MRKAVFVVMLSLVVPAVFAMGNWVAQWAAYQFTLQALHIPARPAASFTIFMSLTLRRLDSTAAERWTGASILRRTFLP